MNRSLLLILSFVLVVLAQTAHDEAGFGGFHLMQKPAGVGAVGRGYTGVVSQSAFARYYNPAMYGKREGFSFGIEYSNGTTSDLQSTAFEIAARVNSLFMAFEGANHTIDGIYLTGEFPEGVDYNNSSAWQFSELTFSLGSQPLEELRWALTLGGAFDQFESERAYALFFGLGVTYDFFDEALTVGASALNWGLTTPMWGEGNENLGEGENLPSTLGLGVGYTHSFGDVKLLATVDGVYTHRFSDSTRTVESEVGERFSVPLGVEVTPVPWATVRVGKRIHGGSDVVNFGAGFSADWITTDFAFVIHSLEEQTHLEWMASINMAFGKMSHKKKTKIVVKEPLLVTPLEEPPLQSDTNAIETGTPENPAVDTTAELSVEPEKTTSLSTEQPLVESAPTLSLETPKLPVEKSEEEVIKKEEELNLIQ